MVERRKELDELLCEPRMARIATVSPRNVPHIVQVVYIFDPEEGSFFISTGAPSVPVPTLRRNPAMTIIVDDDAFPFRAVMAEGKPNISEPLGTDHEGLKRVVDHFYEPGMWEKWVKTPSAEKTRVRLTLVPERWKWWDQRRKINGSVRIG